MRAILTYHSLDDSGSPISVSPAVFAQHAAWLRAGHVQVTTIPELLALPSSADAVAITFDDGFANFTSEAASRLSGLPVTLFVVSDYAGRTNSWGGRETPGVPTLPLLDWPALGHLAESGVTLGAHTRTHPDLATLSPGQVDDELEGCAERMRAETGVRPLQFAYPFGSTTRDVVERAGRHFPLCVTTELRALAGVEPPAELPRIDMYYLRRSGQLEGWGTTAFRLRLSARRFLRTTRHGAQVAVGRLSGSTSDSRR